MEHHPIDPTNLRALLSLAMDVLNAKQRVAEQDIIRHDEYDRYEDRDRAEAKLQSVMERKEEAKRLLDLLSTGVNRHQCITLCLGDPQPSF